MDWLLKDYMIGGMVYLLILIRMKMEIGLIGVIDQAMGLVNIGCCHKMAVDSSI
jgi:hypothetical protein